jgi:hypothetical protein
MNGLIDYVLILGFTAIAVYIIYNMIIKMNGSKPGNTPPAFVDTPNAKQIAQLSSVEGTTSSSGLSNHSFDDSVDNAIRNYCIKSSSNSAYTDGYMNLNMIKYVLSRGCRFLDFEIYIKDGVPIVAYSNNKYSMDTFTSDAPAVSLAGALSTIMSNAFSDTSPNEKDPLFIQLRIKTLLPTAYSKIAQIIKGSLGHKLYSQGGVAVPVTLDTQLPQLSGKIVVIVDQASSPGYENYATCSPGTDCASLTDYVNMNSNSQSIRLYDEHSLSFQPINPPDPAAYLLRIVFPSLGLFNNTTNADTFYLIENYGAQIIAQAFYTNDSNLASYEAFFKEYKSAFVPLTTAVKYSQSLNQ